VKRLLILPRSVHAAILATLWVLAPLLGATHGLTHSHRYCAEHGAFEESSPDHREPIAGQSSATTGAARGGHEECAFSQLFCRDAWVGTPENTGSVIGVFQHRGTPALESIEVRPIPLLASAPKSSPPSARI